jgi:hypothetical protein
MREKRRSEDDDRKAGEYQDALKAHRVHFTWKPRQKTSAGSMKIVL